ncbi:DNA-3-methyladenine glycosylase family protein [Pseudalkalibacillus caeni]|uniref:DNA-3-methyladenine glycosylase II n=1 Tax=Exobacillus caeni TaxID=2574798 RepID=A0A5R9F3R0_9BACL|nr:DNA-3-methyladenine glycosylase [Pseudalkalibacillus caeni]TLS37030.1 DNA-3-methyladenine glycosylase 2 family protein [Pseudalkalibacillus caeni]
MRDRELVPFDNKALHSLSEADPEMKKLISLMGDIPLAIGNNHFESLVKSCIGQQLSLKAARTIYNRFQELLDEVTPEAVLTLSDDTLRSVGISKQKASYIKDLSSKVLSEEVLLNTLEDLENEEVIKTLTSVKGIGQWTAEMFLIFSLGRTDVMSLGDVGLQRGCRWLYQVGKEEDGKEMLKRLSSNWDPHYTVASLYLWEAVNRGFTTNYSCIDQAIDDLN